MEAVATPALRWRDTWMPLMSGSRMSSRARSGASVSALRMASAPVPASITSKPASRRVRDFA